MLANVMLFQKIFTKEFISLASSLALLGENLFSVFSSENLFLVSEKSGNFYYLGKCQPWSQLPSIAGDGHNLAQRILNRSEGIKLSLNKF